MQTVRFLSSLKVRLLLLVLLAVVPALVFIFYTGLQELNATATRAEAQSLGIARLTAAEFQTLSSSSEQFLRTLSEFSEVKTSDTEACNRLFAGFLLNNRQYANIGAIHLNGDLFASAVPPARPLNFSDKPWFRSALDTGDFAVGEYMVGPVIGRNTIHLGLPFEGEEGIVKGVVFVALDLEWLDSRLSSAELPPGAALFIIDLNGVVIARYPDPESYVGKQLSETPISKIILDTRAEGTAQAVGFDGQPRLFGFVPLTDTGSGPFLAVSIPRSIALAEVNEVLRRNLLTLLAVAMLLFAASWVLTSRLVLRPVQRLVQTTRRVGAGDLEARTGMAKDGSEIGQLARAFDEMGQYLLQQSIAREQADRELRGRTSELEAANRELESFSYSVSHDLRAPLRAIDGFSQVILEEYADKLDDEGKRYLGIVRANSQKMAQLINDLLAFSRLGRKALDVTEVDIASLVREIIGECMAEAGDRAIEWKIAELPSTSADRALIRQVLLNLMANAIKFTRPREKAVIELGTSDGKGETVYFVRDNGVGFDMRYRDKLFGVFQRLHSDNEFGGTGVGLAIVQRIIHRHGGRVWAESKPDEGATFYFTLPKVS